MKTAIYANKMIYYNNNYYNNYYCNSSIKILKKDTRLGIETSFH